MNRPIRKDYLITDTSVPSMPSYRNQHYRKDMEKYANSLEADLIKANNELKALREENKALEEDVEFLIPLVDKMRLENKSLIKLIDDMSSFLTDISPDLEARINKTLEEAKLKAAYDETKDDRRTKNRKPKESL